MKIRDSWSGGRWIRPSKAIAVASQGATPVRRSLQPVSPGFRLISGNDGDYISANVFQFSDPWSGHLAEM